MKSRKSRQNGPCLLRAAAFLFCVVSLASKAPAQAGEAPNAGTGPAAVSGATQLHGGVRGGLEDGLIHLDVTVTDETGKPVPDLGESDLTVMDNGVAAPILSFQAVDEATAVPDPPAELILILDPLNLKLDAAGEEKAVVRFLRQNGGHLALPTTVYRLSLDGLSVTSERTTDGNQLAAEIAEKRKMRRVWDHESHRCESAFCPQLHDGGIDDALSSQRVVGTIAVEARHRPGRKLAIWVGYGWPVSSETHAFNFITEFSTRLREAHLALYRVNAWDDHKVKRQDSPFSYKQFLNPVRSEDVALPGNLCLEVLAVQSGGGVYGAMEYADSANHHVPAETIDGMVIAPINRILVDASSFYRLSFSPAHTGQVDEYHDLKVVVGKPGLTARTNTGYYDEPVYYEQPRVAVRHMSVAQLEVMLEEDRKGSDGALAKAIDNVELTERMSSDRLMTWQGRLRGKKAWPALVGVADASAFLPQPAADVPAIPAPTLAEQREQLSHIVHYLGELAPNLPNLFATRTTNRYEEPAWKESDSWKTARADQSLHLEESSSVTVLYRHGSDFEEADTASKKKPKAQSRKLETHGTFGMILGTVVADAMHGKINWDGWERRAAVPGGSAPDAGMTAVFSYSVPQGASHYHVSQCCYPEYLGGGAFEMSPGYHGKIAFDPATGAILRLTLQPELNGKLPLTRSDIAVEYATVKGVDSHYLCPARSVSVSRQRTVRPIQEWGTTLETYAPFETLVTDVSFHDYHRFGSTSNLLPAYEPVPETKK